MNEEKKSLIETILLCDLLFSTFIIWLFSLGYVSYSLLLLCVMYGHNFVVLVNSDKGNQQVSRR